MPRGAVDPQKKEQIDPLPAIVVEPDTDTASGIRRPTALPERIEMKAIHEVDSPAYAVAAGSQACVDPGP